MPSMIDDDFDFDQPVTRIPQNPQATKLLGNRLLQQAEQYLASMGSRPHAQLVESLRQLESEDSYFAVMAKSWLTGRMAILPASRFFT